MSSSTTLSIAPAASATIDKPYLLTIDSTARASGQWRYNLTNPNGTVSRDAGELAGADTDVLLLYAIAVALTNIPKGVSIEIRSNNHQLGIMVQRLTAPSPVPQLPFLPFVESRRTAWRHLLPILAGYTVSWKTVTSSMTELIDLAAWQRAR